MPPILAIPARAATQGPCTCPPEAEPVDPKAQRAHDRRRWVRALNLSLLAVLLVFAVFSAQGGFDLGTWAVRPGSIDGLLGVLAAPLLHGSIEHVATNAIALLMLGTLAGGLYPRATPWALPLMWLGSGLGAWWLGEAGIATPGRQRRDPRADVPGVRAGPAAPRPPGRSRRR